MNLGICKSTECVAAGNGPIELYEGPGEHCPACGELLEPHVPERVPSALPDVPARAAQLAAPSVVPRPRFKSGLLLMAGSTMAVLCGIAIWYFRGGTVGACGSSMTERVSRDLLRGYNAQAGTRSDRFQPRSTNCSIRFGVQLVADPKEGRGLRVIGLDGVVAIVNPQNPVAQLSIEQLRKIVGGDLTNWSFVGNQSRPIVVYVPAASTDEGSVVAAALMKGDPISASVVRVPSSEAVVRAVVAARNPGAIGLVAFTQAVPGKVLALQGFPPPSVLSIGDGRYPFAVQLTVAPADAQHSASERLLLTYIASDNANAIVRRAGIITEEAIR
jgi:hypothetical protein